MRRINNKKGFTRTLTKKLLVSGFTLIELLVVMAVIGILASVILASLINARDKGRDASVESNLRNAMAQAEIFRGTNLVANDTYIDVCTNGQVGGTNGVGNLVLAAAQATGLSSYGINNVPAASTSVATCNSTSLAFAAEAPLRTAGQMWCVDSTGKSALETVSIGATAVCP